MKLVIRLSSGLLLIVFLLMACNGQQASEDFDPSVGEPGETVQPAQESIELTPLTLCASGTSGAHVVGWYALDQGLFENYGLDVSLIDIGGGSKAAAALIAGEVDVCQMAGSGVFNAVIAGEDLALIANLYNAYLYTLVVSPDIHTGEDLIGKAIAISSPGSATELAVRKALQSLGLDVDKDVTLLAAGEDGDRLQAMESGQVAGTVISPPMTLLARNKGYHELVNLSEQHWPYIRLGYATTRDMISEDRETMVAFMKAILESIYRLKNDPAGAKASLAKYMLLDVEGDAAILEEAYQELIKKYLLEVPIVSEESIDAILQEIALENPDAATLQPDSFIDRSLLQELIDAGFLEQLKAGE